MAAAEVAVATAVVLVAASAAAVVEVAMVVAPAPAAQVAHAVMAAASTAKRKFGYLVQVPGPESTKALSSAFVFCFNTARDAETQCLVAHEQGDQLIGPDLAAPVAMHGGVKGRAFR